MMQINEDFNRKYEKLSILQKKAVDWKNGPLAVIAGPGSGKTRVLTLRIAKLLSDSEKENYRILGLTFTNKAADEMRTRVIEMLPNEKDRLFLGTFHSFCATVLRNHGSYVDVSPNFSIYSDPKDLNEILKDVLMELKGENYDYSYENKNYISIIQYLLRNLVDPDNDVFFEKLVTNDNARQEINSIYQMYWEKLRQYNALDFDTLIFKVNLLFKKYPFVSKHYRTMYPYICIDEFQDTNIAQYQLIKNMLNDKIDNIFIVADEDQLIFQWNGASNKRLHDFKKDFNSDIVQLTDNFRCPSQIVTIANDLISHNTERLVDKFPSKSVKNLKDKGGIITLKSFDSFSQELEWIYEDISSKERVNSTALISRSNKMINNVYEYLVSRNLPAAISKRKNQFENPEMYFLHSLLRLSNKRNDKKYLTEVIYGFSYLTQTIFPYLSSDQVDEDVIIAWSESQDGDYLKGFFEIIKNLDIGSEFIESLNINLIEGKDFLLFINDTFNWFESTISKTRENESNDLYFEEKEILKNFIAILRQKYGIEKLRLSVFLQELDMSSKSKNHDEKSCIQCLTIHGSKGKEFDHVYLVGLVEDELPSYMSKKQGEESIEEERRSCFVAITRAVETLTMTYSSTYDRWNKSPSRFIKEMGL